MAEAIPLSEGFDESECARRRETERLGTDRIIPLVLRLSLPAMLGLLVSSLYVFVDRLFVGNLIGEVGLAGEIRPAPRGQERLKEAAKLGFTHALIPHANAPRHPIPGMQVITVRRIDEAVMRLRELE